MSNYISANLSPDDQKRALELIAELRKIFSFGIKLNNSTKRGMPMLDDGRRPFAAKALQYGGSEPKIVAPYTDLKELKVDLDLYDALGPVEMEALSFTEMISDTRMAAGSDAYVTALAIYKSAKGALKSGVPGTQSIVDELSKLFEYQGKSPKDSIASKG